MTTNLSHPNNKKANALAQHQRVTSVWANDLSRGKITRSKVDRLISEYSPETQIELKHWLNTYRQAIRERKQFSQPKRRVVPPWVKR